MPGKLFILYQMGSSEEYIWYGVVAVFLTEDALWDYAKEKGVDSELKLVKPDARGEVNLLEPIEFVAVESTEGEVPDVEFPNQAA